MYVDDIIDIVIDNHAKGISKDDIEDKINDYMRENWIAITGYGDE